jgi:ribokinase
VQPGETLASRGLETGLGGKGANQSVAIARAGIGVAHIGRVSTSDAWAVDTLRSAGVLIDHIELVEEASGHAIIQVDDQGENAIVLHGGANQSFDTERIEAIIASHSVDYLLMQNECNLLAEALEVAHRHALKVVLNPAPMTERIKDLPLHQLDTLIVNEVEAAALTDKSNIADIILAIQSTLPNTRTVLTLGAQGAVLLHGGQKINANAVEVDVVDTTGAGDTFVGYFLAGLVQGLSDNESLERACLAAALAVSQPGAISSIPTLSQLPR